MAFLRLAVAAVAGALSVGGLAPTAAAASGSPVSVTVELASAHSQALKSLQMMHQPATAQRVAALRSALPSAAVRQRVTSYAEDRSLRVTGQTPWSVNLTGSAAAVRAAFGAGTPASLSAEVRGDVAGVVTSQDSAGQLRPLFDPEPIDGSDARWLYDAPSGKPPSGVAAPTIATLQFSGWDTNDLVDFASKTGHVNPLGSGQYTAVAVGGSPTTPDGVGGEVEVALDQETLLQVAPYANQRAYFAPNGDQGELNALNRIATDATNPALHLVALSVSWGRCEADEPLSALTAIDTALSRVVAAGVTVFAATGDSGAYDCSPDGDPTTGLAVDYPASDPNVVAVGGTTVDPLTGEQRAWSGGGGGVSTVFSEPAYQQSRGTTTGRVVPDIALAADPGEEIVADGQEGLASGTSLSAPLAAATFTDMLASNGYDQGIGEIHANLYGAPAGDFGDVVSGGNGGYTARPGFDAVSGLGTPRWNHLALALIGLPTISAPAYSKHRTFHITVGQPRGMVFRTWRVGTGAEPTSCDPATSKATRPTTATATHQGRNTVWVVGYAPSGYCYIATAATRVDTVAPVSHVSAKVRGGKLRLHWSASDRAPSSGLTAYTVTVKRSGSAKAVYHARTTKRALTIAAKRRTSYTVTVTVADRAGNVSRAARAHAYRP